MDNMLEKVIRGLETALVLPWTDYDNRNAIYCTIQDAITLLKAQDEVIQGLRKVGYPHDFYLEEPWVVSYMYAITDVIKKAVNLNNERFAGKDDSGTGRSEKLIYYII